MVDQAQITDGRTQGVGQENGHSAPRAVAHNMAELAHDAITLGELQLELLRCDINQALGRLVVPTVLVITGAVLLLSCVPIALACIALFIDELTDLTLAQSFLITLAIGLVLGGLVALAGAWLLKKSFDVLSRSKNELQQNVRWVKTMFKRLGTSEHRRSLAEYETRYVS